MSACLAEVDGGAGYVARMELNAENRRSDRVRTRHELSGGGLNPDLLRTKLEWDEA